LLIETKTRTTNNPPSQSADLLVKFGFQLRRTGARMGRQDNFWFRAHRVEREEGSMALVDTNGLKVVERLPGWKGRYFHSASMTFAHYEFAAGSSIHEHSHPEEEVYK
jgi:quercetin dioxygenase-like cupin family protein